MRTARLLTVAQHALRSGEGCLPGGVVTARRGVSQHAMGQTLALPCGQTDTRKNITFANFVCGR